MRKLFIIGNGFDLAHGLPTSYLDFKDFLIQCKNKRTLTEYFTPIRLMNQDDAIVYDKDVVIEFLLTVITNTRHNAWNDLERTLGEIDYSEVLDDAVLEEDRDGDTDYFRTIRNIAPIASELVIPMKRISLYFMLWIETIVIDRNICKIPGFCDLISEDTSFMNFNYTNTLEEIYEIDKVYHIHGRQEEEIIFGHGDLDDRLDVYQSNHLGAEDYLMEIHLALRKNVKFAFDNNVDFFESIDDRLHEIYSFGFSFGEVDMIYIREIIQRCDSSKVIWYLNDFNPEDERNEFIKAIKSEGYLGSFDTFKLP